MYINLGRTFLKGCIERSLGEQHNSITQLRGADIGLFTFHYRALAQLFRFIQRQVALANRRCTDKHAGSETSGCSIKKRNIAKFYVIVSCPSIDRKLETCVLDETQTNVILSCLGSKPGPGSRNRKDSTRYTTRAPAGDSRVVVSVSGE